ncbi:hypothetical protein [Pseudomonas sp. PWP3-1]
MQNLTNKTYVSQCASDLDCYYGEGRTVVSSLTYDWYAVGCRTRPD